MNYLKIIFIKFQSIIFKKIKIKIYGTNKTSIYLSTKAKDNSMFLGTYEEKTTKEILKQIGHNNVVYDIGANVGYFALIMAKHVGIKGKVFAFEPLPKNIELLNENIKYNKLTNVYLHKIAVADKNTQLNFTNSGNDVANTYITNSPIYEKSDKITVQANSIDNLVENKIIEIPTFIKIDVEGAEYDVLEGAVKTINKHKPKIFIATHDNHNPNVKTKCLNFLNEKGYIIGSVNKSDNGLMEDFIATYGK